MRRSEVSALRWATDVMLAENWETSRMVAHYSAGATAERGAVADFQALGAERPPHRRVSRGTSDEASGGRRRTLEVLTSTTGKQGSADDANRP